MPNFVKTLFCFFLLVCINLPVFATQEPAQQLAAAQDNDSQGTAEAPAPRRQQYYIVEVVLFKHLSEQGKRDEFWSRPDIIAEPDLSVLANNDNENYQSSDDIPALAEYDPQNRYFLPLRNGVATLSSQNYKLSDSAAHLRYSQNYKILAHFGWTQRSLSKKRALPIRISSKQFSDTLVPGGTLRLYTSRFLHMEVDLKASQCVFPEPSVPEQASTDDTNKTLDGQKEKDDSGAAAHQESTAAIAANSTTSSSLDSGQCVNQVYQFKQNRKMRSRELHYIDNPVFGLLIYVTPFSS